MLGLFKRIGKVLLYIVEVPIFIVALALFAVVGLIGIIILFIKSIVLFFTGRSLYDDLPEDKKAKDIIKRSSPGYVEPTTTEPQARQLPPQNPAPAPVYQQPQSVNNSQNNYQPNQSQESIESFVFEDENNVPEQEIRIEENEQEYPRFERNSEQIQPNIEAEKPETNNSFEPEQETNDEDKIHVDDMIDDLDEEEEIERYVPKSDMFRNINEPKSDDDSGIEIDYDEEDR